MKDRIIKFIEAEKLTAAEFADQIGVQRSSVSHVLNGRNNPSFAFIQKMIEHFPNINSRWLLTGEGDIYGPKPNSVVSETKPQSKLFSTDDLRHDRTDQQLPEDDLKVNNTAVSEPASVETLETKRSEIPQRKVVKVLIFYDDQTFEDFRPAK